MSAPPSLDQIRAMIADDSLEQAIELLKEHPGVRDGALHRECLGHAGRLAHLRQRKRRGELGVEQEVVERNRQRAALLELVDEVGQVTRPVAGTAHERDASASPRDDAAPVDILLVTILPEEYAAVLCRLNEVRPVQGTTDAPNLYGWRLGTIARLGGGYYRVALALVGRAGNTGASQAVARSAERWKPRYALLVGIAGGLPREGCAVGDVVVSTEIYGYEYGKIDGGFQPRPNWTYQVDRGLLNSAQGFSVASLEWWTGGGVAPKVLFGPVASGEKVVEDPVEPFFAAVVKQWPKLQAVEMEGAGAAAAIDELHAVGKDAIGFLMVRGISDMPRPLAERPGLADQANQTGERDTNKKRACDAAAAFAVSWIASEWPVGPRASVPAGAA